MKRFLPVAVLAAASLTVTACGTSQQAQHEPALKPQAQRTEITHEAFVQQLDAWCAEGNKQLEPLRKAYEKAAEDNDYGKVADVLESVPSYVLDMPDGPPAADRQNYTRYRDALVQQDGLTLRKIKALRAKDNEALSTIVSLMDDASKERVKAAVALGATECGAVN
jgi:hypothetical protein